MPGPLPKEASTRRRSNRRQSAGARQLQVVAKPVVPDLPGDHPWHPRTVAWWGRVWSSPMAGELDDSDFDQLLMLAMLVDRFWHDPTPSLAAEIRLQGQRFGLSPIDRRRLQWEIERGEEAAGKRAKRAAAKSPANPRARAKDPRQLLAV